MSRHRPPGYQLPRLVVRPWMWAVSVLLWALLTAAAAAREMPPLGVGLCIGAVAVSAWNGGRQAGQEEL